MSGAGRNHADQRENQADKCGPKQITDTGRQEFGDAVIGVGG